jgi:biopolymer transport protein TolR
MSTPIHAVPVAEPNMTPMIDVLLVMIIVFMVMMVQVHHSMDVVLPDVCRGVCAGGDGIVLEVLPGQEYRLNGQIVAARELATKLTAVYEGRPEKVIQIAAGSRVRYDDVMHAMDVAKTAGVRVIGIAPKGTWR